MEQRRHEQLLAKLQAENESRIRSIQAQAEQSAQSDKQQRTQMTNAMVAAERRRAEFQRMSAQRMQHQRDSRCLYRILCSLPCADQYNRQPTFKPPLLRCAMRTLCSFERTESSS